MTRVTQCTRALYRLPACLAAAGWLLLIPCAQAQVRYRVDRQENLRLEPGPAGTLLGTVQAGVEVVGGEVREGWVQVTLEGWIWGQSVVPRVRDGFTLAVRPPSGENLRAQPNGSVRARLREGCLLEEVERRSGWVRIRRTAWMWQRSLTRLDPPSADSVTGPAEPGVAGPPTLDRATLRTQTLVARTANGDSVGALAPGLPVRVLGRAGGWARVQLDVWVPASALRPGAAGVLVGVSSAEVRARPQDFEGRVLQWHVQVVSQQVADELRPELPAGSRYLLVRGPSPEATFAYVLVPDDWVERVAALAPLADVVLLARVRVGRSRYLGNPVLDLIELAPVER